MRSGTPYIHSVNILKFKIIYVQIAWALLTTTIYVQSQSCLLFTIIHFTLIGDNITVQIVQHLGPLVGMGEGWNISVNWENENIVQLKEENFGGTERELKIEVENGRRKWTWECQNRNGKRFTKISHNVFLVLQKGKAK